MSDPEDPVADAAWQTLFLSAWAEAPLPGFAEGGAPAPSPVVATESPDRAGVQDALLVLIFCYLRLEPQCRLTLCRRNARPILHVVAVVHPRGETGRRSLRVIATPRSDCRFPLSSHGVQREDDQKQVAQGPPKHLRCVTFLHGLIITTELNKRSLMNF